MSDFDFEPTMSDRQDVCILCNESWFEHCGFACRRTAKKYSYEEQTDINKLPRDERFFTQKMRDRLVAHLGAEAWKKAPPVLDMTHIAGETGDDWRQFQNKAPGECPCGTNRSACIYHR